RGRSNASIVSHSFRPRVLFLLTTLIATTAVAQTGPATEPTMQTLSLPDDRTIRFLQFGEHSFVPDTVTDDNGKNIQFKRGEAELIAPFQQLYAVPVRFDAKPDTQLRMQKTAARDSFWDQVIPIGLELRGEAPKYRVTETGTFGSALPAARDLTQQQV